MDYFTWCIVIAGSIMALGSIPVSISQSIAIKAAVEGVARNPAASGKVLTTMLIGVAMIESLAIYIFVVAMIILLGNPFIQYVVNTAAN